MAPRDFEHVARSDGAHVQGLNGMREILPRARKRSQMPHMIEGAAGVGRVICSNDIVPGHVALDQPETRIAFQLREIAPRSGDQIVHADHVVAEMNKTIAEMRSDESGRAGDEMTHAPF